MRDAVLRNITVKADALAVEYNKTKDPGLRDQWYKLIKTVDQYHPPKQERKKILGKAAIR